MAETERDRSYRTTCVSNIISILSLPGYGISAQTGAEAVLKNIKNALNGKVDILFNAEADRVLLSKGKATGIRLKSGVKLHAGIVILAPGREGSRWLEKESKRLRLTLLKNPVDIGVRVEIPASVFEPITRVTYEPKLVFHSKKFNDKVRTFCVNPYGEVVKEYLKGIWTVNGHSYSDRKSENTNFALLVSTVFTEPFDEPILYGSYIAGLANLLGKGVLLQRLGDLRLGRRSTHARIAQGAVKPTLHDATPGRPELRHPLSLSLRYHRDARRPRRNRTRNEFGTYAVVRR